METLWRRFSCVAVLWMYTTSSGASVDDFGTFLRGNAVGFMFHQSGGTLAAWDTRLKAVRLDHTQRHILVEAGFRTRRTALIKNVTTIHGTAHSYETGHRGTSSTGLHILCKMFNFYITSGLYNNVHILIMISSFTGMCTARDF